MVTSATTTTAIKVANNDLTTRVTSQPTHDEKTRKTKFTQFD